MKAIALSVLLAGIVAAFTLEVATHDYYSRWAYIFPIMIAALGTAWVIEEYKDGQKKPYDPTDETSPHIID